MVISRLDRVRYRKLDKHCCIGKYRVQFVYSSQTLITFFYYLLNVGCAVFDEAPTVT